MGSWRGWGLPQGWVVPRVEVQGESDCSQARACSYESGQPLPPISPSCSLPALFSGRWTFGDGEQMIGQFKPPYDESFQVPDPMVAQVLVEHNTTHTYTIPGEGGPLPWGQPRLGPYSGGKEGVQG